MSANKYIPHVLVLPEDDANREIANGFMLHAELDLRSLQVLGSAGGWRKLRDSFESEHIPAMRSYQHRHMVLLVDFDEDPGRLEAMTSVIPQELEDRVFVIGVWSEPEDMKRAGLGSNEDVGAQIASECFEDARDVWDHQLLKHNTKELDRMSPLIRPILFPSV